MRSIFGMPSADLAGAAKRCVPLHYYKEEGNGNCGLDYSCVVSGLACSLPFPAMPQEEAGRLHGLSGNVRKM